MLEGTMLLHILSHCSFRAVAAHELGSCAGVAVF